MPPASFEAPLPCGYQCGYVSIQSQALSGFNMLNRGQWAGTHRGLEKGMSELPPVPNNYRLDYIYPEEGDISAGW